ncbi:MAG: sugar ABC transporter permease [Devosia sp.]|nr:sugar ABC transporter permease [Devosia sp.]
MSYLFMLPYLVLLFMFGVFPVLYAFGLSFFDTIDMVFWGLTNYEFAFNDFRVPKSAVNVLTFVSLWVSLTVLGVAVLSLMLDSLGRRSATTLRTIFFLPGAVTSSAIVVLWLFVLDPSVSPFQSIFHLVGWDTRQNVISGLSFAGVFAIMAYFSASGGWIVVFGGALSSLPTEVMEAARIDGANRFQLATRIKLPMIWRSVVLMAILSFAAGLQLFVEPQLMSLAGQQFSQVDWSLNQLAFQYAFKMGDFGASAALSTLLVGTSIAIALIIIFATKFYTID